MRIDNILYAVACASLIIMVVLFFQEFWGAAFIAFVVFGGTTFIGFRFHCALVYRHDLMNVNRKYTPQQILQEVVDTFERNKWKPAAGPGAVNYQYSKLGGLINGPVVSAELTQNQLSESEYQLDLWASFVPTAGKFDSPKHGGKAISIKKKIQEACAKFEQ